MNIKLATIAALLTLSTLAAGSAGAQPEIPICSRCIVDTGIAPNTEGLFYAFEKLDATLETVVDAGADSPQLLWTLESDPQTPGDGRILDARGELACELAGGTLLDARGAAVLEVDDGVVYEPGSRTPLLTFVGYQAIEGDPASGQPAWESTRHADDAGDLVRAATGALHLGACGATAEPPERYGCVEFGPESSLCTGEGLTFESRDLVMTDCMTDWPGEPLACETSAALSPGLPAEFWSGAARAVIDCVEGTALTCEHSGSELRCWCAGGGAADGGTFKIKKQSDGSEG